MYSDDIRHVVPKLLKKYRRFIKFGIVGFLNTAASLVVYYTLVACFIHYQYANVVAFIVSSLNGFFLNRRWVFKVADQPFVIQINRYYMVYLGSLLLSISLSYVWIEIAGLSEYVAPLLNLVFTIPFNYILSKIWTFRRRRQTDQ